MKYATINPYNNVTVKEFAFDPYPDMEASVVAFKQWRKLSVQERSRQLMNVAALLQKNKDQYAALITLEMGKPLNEALYEINKSITAFEYYCTHAEAFLQPQFISTAAGKSYVRHDPLGIIFSIMPWNFPFWQVFRFAVPTLIAGNVSILKHAPNVPQCARAIEQLFEEAIGTKDIFRNYFLSNEDAATLLSDNRIAGLSFTGSDATGSYLSALAGKHLKKSVLELGGNDAFIVLDDADIDLTVSGAIKSRCINTGQACNGAKRFIVTPGIAAAFEQKLTEGVLNLKAGDPMLNDTNLGPLARPDLKEKVMRQIAETVQQGSSIRQGTVPKYSTGNFVPATVLSGVTPDMTAAREEIFGPVWSIMPARDEAHALALANDTLYGLAASVWTKQTDKAEAVAAELEAGNVFINDIVKSDPRLPFGGIKKSGYGRELSKAGLLEFVNLKTVYVR